MLLAVITLFSLTHFVAMKRGMELDEQLQTKRKKKNEKQSQRNY